MLDFPGLLARGLLIHLPDPNAYCHPLAKEFGKHVISIALFLTLIYKVNAIQKQDPAVPCICK
jgi:hypothetical protein